MLKLTGQPAGNGVLSGWAAMQAFTDMKAANGLLDDCTLRLYTDGPTPNTAQLWTEFTEATFDGYAAINPLVWSANAWEDGYAQVVSLDPPPVFTATNATTPEDVKGWAITKTIAATETVIYAEDFNELKPMQMAGHQVVVVPTLNLHAAS